MKINNLDWKTIRPIIIESATHFMVAKVVSAAVEKLFSSMPVGVRDSFKIAAAVALIVHGDLRSSPYKMAALICAFVLSIFLPSYKRPSILVEVLPRSTSAPLQGTYKKLFDLITQDRHKILMGIESRVLLNNFVNLATYQEATSQWKFLAWNIDEMFIQIKQEGFLNQISESPSFKALIAKLSHQPTLLYVPSALQLFSNKQFCHDFFAQLPSQTRIVTTLPNSTYYSKIRAVSPDHIEKFQPLFRNDLLVKIDDDRGVERSEVVP